MCVCVHSVVGLMGGWGSGGGDLSLEWNTFKTVKAKR